MKRYAIGVILSFSLCTTSAFACAGGLDFQKESGLYKVDVTDDTPMILPLMDVHFDYGLINVSDPAYGPDDEVSYSSVEASITHGKDVIFDQKLAMQPYRELNGFAFKFPKANASDVLHVRFLKNQTLMASADFPLTVGSGDPTLFTLQNGVIAIICLLALALIVRKKMG
ncbi:MAG TPA: hypothetical protein VHA78_02915 [Candidatus Peribacteraceae bacterium]|nr:hypothetical protein [Candidatus Peribacteraceae bacterium]